MVGDEAVVARRSVIQFLAVTFEVPTRHSDKDVQNAVRELNLDFWGEI